MWFNMEYIEGWRGEGGGGKGGGEGRRGGRGVSVHLLD